MSVYEWIFEGLYLNLFSLLCYKPLQLLILNLFKLRQTKLRSVPPVTCVYTSTRAHYKHYTQLNLVIIIIIIIIVVVVVVVVSITCNIFDIIVSTSIINILIVHPIKPLRVFKYNYNFQIERRISAFIQRKQTDVDLLNKREFCSVLDVSDNNGKTSLM